MLNYSYTPLEYTSIGWINITNSNFESLKNILNTYSKYGSTHNSFNCISLHNATPELDGTPTLKKKNEGSGEIEEGTYTYYLVFRSFEYDTEVTSSRRLYDVTDKVPLGSITLTQKSNVEVNVSFKTPSSWIKGWQIYRQKEGDIYIYFIKEGIIENYDNDIITISILDDVGNPTSEDYYYSENILMGLIDISNNNQLSPIMTYFNEDITSVRFYRNLQIKEQKPKLTFIDIIDTDIKIDNGITIQRYLTTDDVSVTGEYFKIINNNEDITGNSNNSLIEINTYRRAIGIGTTGQYIGNYACGIGRITNASGSDSFAVGYFAQSGGTYSIAIGYNTKTYFDNCCAIGYYIRCNNFASYGFGRHIKTEKDYSFVLGIYTITKLAKGCFAYSSEGRIDGNTWPSAQVEKIILHKKDLLDNDNYFYLEGINGETTFFVQDVFMYAIEIKALFTHTNSYGAGNSTFIIKRGLVGRSSALGQAQKYMSNEEYYGTSMPAYLDVEIDIDGNLRIKAKVQGSSNEYYNVVAEITVIECLKTDI